MTERKYSSTAGASALTTSASDTVTSIGLTTTAGLPTQYPYTLVLDPGTVSEEIVTVVNASGTVLTVTRGEDGTSAQGHSAGAIVRHMATARDFREPQQHIEATVAHGRSSALVGVTDTQTIQNKTFDTTNVFPAVAKASLPADTVYTAATQTLTGKTMSGASNTFTAIPKSALPSDIYYGATTALPVAALAHYGAALTVTSSRLVWTSGDVVSDAAGSWSASNPSRLTAKSAGTYLVTAFYSADTNGNSAATAVTLYKNGTAVAAANGSITISASPPTVFETIPATLTFPVTLAVNDYVEINAAGGAGSSFTYSFILQRIV